MSIALSNGKKKGNVTRFLSPKSNSESSFAGYLYFWFLVTILPQAMLISRTDGGNLVLKLALCGSFVFLSFIKIVSSRVSISSQRVLSCIILFCILLAATGLANQQELSIDAMTSLITIFTNYAILMVFFGNAKLTYSGLSKVARLYQAFILYACVFNVIKNGHY